LTVMNTRHLKPKPSLRATQVVLKRELCRNAKKNDADNAARDSKRADFLRSQNVPDSVIAEMLALK